VIVLFLVYGFMSRNVYVAGLSWFVLGLSLLALLPALLVCVFVHWGYLTPRILPPRCAG
jgi:hypothetical protein